ncbi:MAG: serine hydrolase domain-containing protein, partial [Thermomicrobiales bacterium]
MATLVEEGGLGWDATPADILPGVATTIHPALRAIWLEDLLAHRAGIDPFVGHARFAQLPPFGGSARDQRLAFAEWLLRQEPFVTPRSGNVYSNAGYTIVAAMIERVTDQSWESLIRSRLFEPLDLASAGFDWPTENDPNQPWGHRKLPQGFVPHAYPVTPFEAPVGDVHS